MEFVGFAEVWTELKARGLVERERGDRSLRLGIDPGRHPVTVRLGGTPDGAPDLCVPCDGERAAAALETALHKLHLASLYVIPIGRWREVFDALSFGLAAHDAWREIESQASLQQNGRDPLLCAPRDLHLLREMVRLLIVEGEPNAGQTISIIATGQLLVADVEPQKPILVAVGSATVAQQIRDAAAHYLSAGHDREARHG